MLASLFQGSSKTVTSLESRTEEDHSRSLLWPSQILDPHRSLALSPPHTPVSSPTFRLGTHDDRGGLELNDLKDARIIVAQDAFGNMDRPMVLYDSLKHEQHDPPQHTRTPSNVHTPNIQSLKKGQPISPNAQQRNRSTTISGSSSAWSRPGRDNENNDKVNRLLDCMFGVTSATKSESSTKMHVLLAGQDQKASHPQTIHPTSHKQPLMRAPLVRARTSNQISATQKIPKVQQDDASVADDIILITRMFTVALPESKESVPKIPRDNNEVADDAGSPLDENPAGKKSKLIEKKVPMFAVAVMLQLPPDDLKRNLSRPPSRTSMTSATFPSSLGSEVASSWTLLEAIPDSLASSSHSRKGADRRIACITNIWDIILRSLAYMEKRSHVEIEKLLIEVNRQMQISVVKTPKGPLEQRTNQRNIYLRNAFPPSISQKLDAVASSLQTRICLALRIPKAITGLGFVDGHWLDEARYLIQVCKSKTQDSFLFNLLTAFLGNHTQWLEKIGCDVRKQQGHRQHRRDLKSASVSSRTVIVADRRSIARRLIFLLASFLPSPSGVNAFDRVPSSKSPLHTPGLSTSYGQQEPAQQLTIKTATRRINRAQHVSFGNTDFVGLSTSVSSTGSAASKGSSKYTRPQLLRKDSDTTSLRNLTRVPSSQPSVHMRKASATLPATTPLPVTSMPFHVAKRKGYFDEGGNASAIDESNSAFVSAEGLQNILRRDSSNFAPSSAGSTWGSILGGLWQKRNEGASSAAPLSPRKALDERERHYSRIPDSSSSFGGNKLQDMVQEAIGGNTTPNEYSYDDAFFDSGRALSQDQPIQPEKKNSIRPPRLRVDEEDGVVDVDVGLPGFLAWDGENGPLSPSRPDMSNSVRSFDLAASFPSSLSQSTSLCPPNNTDNLNVAGYLKRYHEDFTLQAVGFYDELAAEIMQSMAREADSNAKPRIERKNSTSLGHRDEWVDISSTLVADARKFSIERLTLRRRKSAPGTTPGPAAPQAAAALLSAEPQADYEDKFFIEIVKDFDDTLTEAIESMLDTSMHPGGPANSHPAHSRTHSASKTPSAIATPPLSGGYFQTKDATGIRADCRQAVADALKEVVKSVNSGLVHHNNSVPVIPKNNARHQGAGPEGHEENVLREGVKKWLLDVEQLQQREVW